jgi:hypothetical protein
MRTPVEWYTFEYGIYHLYMPLSPFLFLFRHDDIDRGRFLADSCHEMSYHTIHNVDKPCRSSPYLIPLQTPNLARPENSVIPRSVQLVQGY